MNRVIELKKKGESINLSKTSGSGIGELLVNLNWNQKPQNQTGKGGFLSGLLGKGASQADLDLGCLYELKNGQKGCIQALGNAFGNLNQLPYIQLDHDDRTGAAAGGENLRINGDRVQEMRRILVYTFIYQGAANWSEVDGVVTLKYGTGQDIEVKLDEHRNGQTMCAIAMIENVQDQTFNVTRLVEYFHGHAKMDRAFGWGMKWQAGRK
ncbi:Tellurium resistance [Bacillus sp. FJAT-42376]|uniref:TerD family protein n=1 Tax=Bacillus sp. FJAT-42376 TaxID=2014076 RepID=UPI000F514F49|nr:Tellurium resistance [Bacillus sp. FJAT-42376]AZB43435.1 Tellurium resistance [Bacillus sp. FJAT-42376]